MATTLGLFVIDNIDISVDIGMSGERVKRKPRGADVAVRLSTLHAQLG